MDDGLIPAAAEEESRSIPRYGHGGRRSGPLGPQGEEHVQETRPGRAAAQPEEQQPASHGAGSPTDGGATAKHEQPVRRGLFRIVVCFVAF